MEKEITKLKRQLEEVESMVENLKSELLKAKTVNIGCNVVILAGNPCGLLRFIAEDDKYYFNINFSMMIFLNKDLLNEYLFCYF